MFSRLRQRGLVLTPYIVLAVSVGVLVYVWTLWSDIKGLKQELVETRAAIVSLKAQLSAEEQARNQFQASAQRCTESLRKINEVQRKRRAQYESSLAAQRLETQQIERWRDELLARQRPTGQTECLAMKEVLNNEILRRSARTSP